MILPARSQVLRKIKVTDPSKDLVVVNQEIHPSILVANSIVNSQNPCVLILNINEENTIIQSSKIKIENLADFDIKELMPYVLAGIKETKKKKKSILLGIFLSRFL